MRVRIKSGKYYLLDQARVLGGPFDTEEEAFACLYKDRVDITAPEAEEEPIPEEFPEDVDFGEPFER